MVRASSEYYSVIGFQFIESWSNALSLHRL